MKKILDFFVSSKTTLVLLIVFAVAMASATFIEEKYDTITAKLLVYNAGWFEILMLLLAVNFIGNIKRYNLLRKGKLGGLLFHLAFIILIIGAGITRYFGYEGTMHIREGESSNVIYSSEPFMQAVIEENGITYKHHTPLYLSDLKSNAFHFSIDTKENGTVDFAYNSVIKNAVDTLIENAEGGLDYLAITVAGANGRENILVKNGEVNDLGSIALAFNNNSRNDAIQITDDNGMIHIKSPYEIKRTKMPEMSIDTVYKDSITEFKPKHLYEVQGPGTMFVFTKLYKSAVKKTVAGHADDHGVDAVIVDVTVKGKTNQVTVQGGDGFIAAFEDAGISNLNLKMAYGQREIELPFSIKLNDFILDRYAGSMSPSSFASEVTLIDKQKNFSQNHHIFMNNVLDYGGFRFFQTSYDRDEMGTILSVNHDFWGTMISYAGYLLLGIGFLFSLLSRSSRYYALHYLINDIRSRRKSATAIVVLMLASTGFAFSQNNTQTIQAAHAEKFGHLIVQTPDGRFEPAHTLAYDVMHKISRQDEFDIPGKGKMNAVQVLLDMIINAEFWKTQKIIYIRENSVKEVLGISDKYACFKDFFDQNNNYKLMDFVSTAYRKNPAEQTTFDKEVIKVDERANIVMMVLQGSMVKIFPAQFSTNNKWVSWNDSLAFVPLTGSITVLNEDLQLEQFNYSNIFRYYLTELYKATQTNDYTRADKVCGYIENIQRQSAAASLLPTPSKVDYEIYYNNLKIFENLRTVYALLSLALLILAFVENLKAAKSKAISLMLNVCSGLLVIAFLFHTFGMGMRWYLTGHAPWSNGYEALILISWAGLLAGFSFMRYSKITLAATALLSFSILMTAGHSSYDPQLTNLQPVLKSYWLIIHVATLTISYGFLGLGFFLGLINLMLMIFRNHKNEKRIDPLIKELTYINEMNITVGLFLATVGTFLGGVWANESWGRYWGWDAKETWALIIVITYTIVLHFRLVPKMKGEYIFNVGSVIAFGSVLMCFVGVNYYLSKGMHSYAAGDTPVFPMWAWMGIASMLALMIYAGVKDAAFKKGIGH